MKKIYEWMKENDASRGTSGKASRGYSDNGSCGSYGTASHRSSSKNEQRNDVIHLLYNDEINDSFPDKDPHFDLFSHLTMNNFQKLMET